MSTNHAQISLASEPGDQGLIAHLMAVTHFVYKETLDRLVQNPRYAKLNINYEGLITLLAERDYSPGELAQRLNISKQLCSKLIRELAALGFIERRSNPNDNRSSLLSLTGEGLALLQEGIATTNAIHEQLAANLGAESLDRLLDIMEQLTRGLEIKLPYYRVFDDGAAAITVPTRLNLLLPHLSQHFRDALQQDLLAKGFTGLKTSHGQILGAINREGKHIQYIASIIGVSKQAVASLAAELEALGYIQRQSNENDKRQVILTLSPLGESLVKASVDSVASLENNIAAVLAADDFLFLMQKSAELYQQLANKFSSPDALAVKIQQLSKQLIAELGETGAHALARELMTMTRGKA